MRMLRVNKVFLRRKQQVVHRQRESSFQLQQNGTDGTLVVCIHERYRGESNARQSSNYPSANWTGMIRVRVPPFAVYDNDKWFLRRFIISSRPSCSTDALLALDESCLCLSHLWRRNEHQTSPRPVGPARHWTLRRNLFGLSTTRSAVFLSSSTSPSRTYRRRRCRIIYGDPGRTAGREVVRARADARVNRPFPIREGLEWLLDFLEPYRVSKIPAVPLVLAPFLPPLLSSLAFFVSACSLCTTIKVRKIKYWFCLRAMAAELRSPPLRPREIFWPSGSLLQILN